MYLSYFCIAYRIFVYLKVYLHSILKEFTDFLVSLAPRGLTLWEDPR